MFIKVFFSWRMRTHLLLTVLLLSLPAIGMILFSAFDERDDALKDGIDETKMVVRSILTEQYNLTGDAEQLVTVLSLLPGVRGKDAGTVHSVLAGILKMNRQFSNIAIADREGTVWASALPFTSPVSVRDLTLFQKVLRRKRFSSGTYGIGRISGKPNIGFGYPVLNASGEIESVIIANIDFEHLNGLLKEAGLPHGALFTLTDRNGVVIYRNVDAGHWIGKVLPKNVFDRMASGGDAVSFLDFGRSEDRMLSCYGKLRLKKEERPYLYVLAGIPLKETLARAERAQFLRIALLSPFLMGALALAALLAKFCFVNQIKKLQEAAERVAGGDLQVRVSERLTGGDLVALGRSFDQMAQQLARREHELNSLNQSLALRVEKETERRLQHERLLARHARLAAIGEMIGAIAHQWRQPLATLGATLQSVRMARERGMLDDRFLESAEADAQKQLYYMSDTIEDFRNFFRPEKVLERFEVTDKIAEVALLVGARFAGAGITLEVLDHSEGSGLVITGYPNEFKQSVLNLISNAFDAVVTANGKRFDATAGIVEVTLRREADTVVVEVADNGCGIPPEYAEKVYEPYFTSKPDGKGTGIGLYMSKLIIEESMGGRLSFRSSSKGTVFRIELSRSCPEGEEDE